MMYVTAGTISPPEMACELTPTNQPVTQRLFFYWIGNWKNETPIQKAGHIAGFTSDRILYDGVAVLLPASIYKIYY